MTINNVNAPTRAEQSSVSDDVCIPPTVNVLGIDEDARVWLWTSDRRRLWKIKLAELNKPLFIQIGGQWVIDNIDKDSKPRMSYVKEQLALISRENQITSSKVRGQGIWPEPDGNGLLIVCGNQAAIFRREGLDSQAIVNHVDGPKYGDFILEYDETAQWCDLDRLLEEASNATLETASDVRSGIMSILDGWNFRIPQCKGLIAAMAIMSPLQAFLDFRPHLWITGGTNTGKTALLTLLERLWLSSHRLDNTTTEAGLRQTISGNSLPVMLDEFEDNPQRELIINMLRSATRGGNIVRGTPGGREINFTLHHIAWVASIEVGLSRAADINRFLIIELLRSDSISIPPSHELRDFKYKMYGVALSIAHQAKSRIREFDGLSLRGVDSRFIQLLYPAVSTSTIIHEIQDNERIADIFLLLFYSLYSEILQDTESDEDQLISDISTSRISGRGLSGTVGTIIANGDHNDELHSFGIRILDNDTLFMNPEMVRRHLLHNTRWSNLNIRDVLLRIEGARSDRQRLSGMNRRGVSLPIGVITGED